MGVETIALVEIENLTYQYFADGDAPAVSGVSLGVQPGEFVLLAGPSGCGKSTLLRAIGALVPHFYGGRFDGTVRVAGRDTRGVKPAELAGSVGFVFQDPESQIVSTGVEAEVAFGLENLGLAPARIAKRTEEILVAMGVSYLRTADVGELSGGELQKVALASVLAMQPDILILDEPTSQLDPVAGENLLASLRRINEEMGTTVILVEHRLDRCYHWVDRVVVMETGRIVCDATPRAAARWALDRDSVFVPPISKVFAECCNGDLPLTVKEGRALLASKRVFIAVGPTKGRPPARDSEPVVAVCGLHYVYPNGTEALRGCDLTVNTGEFVAIMGENGAGKSTLAKHLNGLLRSPRGTVRLCGRSIDGVPTEELARTCALLGQNPNDYLFSETVRDELTFTLKHLAPGIRRDTIDETLDRFGLTDLAGEDPRMLSAGERQRVALASLLVADPKVIVLDEPTRGMDCRNKDVLGECLRQLRSEGKTVLVVTHDVEFAANYADRVLLMGRGRVIADGPTAEVMGDGGFLAPQVGRLLRDVAPGVLTVDEAREMLGAGS